MRRISVVGLTDRAARLETEELHRPVELLDQWLAPCPVPCRGSPVCGIVLCAGRNSVPTAWLLPGSWIRGAARTATSRTARGGTTHRSCGAGCPAWCCSKPRNPIFSLLLELRQRVTRETQP